MLSRDTIIEHVWGFDYEGESENIVDVYVGYLRKKLEEHGPRLIHTERGVGFVLKERMPFIVKPVVVKPETPREEPSFELLVKPGILSFVDVTIHHRFPARTVRRCRGSITAEFGLEPKHYDLLALFLQHPRQVLTREFIFEHIWGVEFDGKSDVVDIHVEHLRAKLEAWGPRLIHTVDSGAGYILQESQPGGQD